MHLLKDSRGKPSWHVTLALIWTTLFGLWFLAGGLNISIAGLHLITATKSASDYMLAIGPWLCALGFREYLEKKNGTSAS